MPPQIANLFEGCQAIEPAGLTDEIFKELPSSRGLVLFANSANEPIQLLCAANIRRTAKARLTTESAGTSAKRKTSITEITARIYYLSCFCNFRNSLKYYEIARILFGDNYIDLLAFGKTWYLKIDVGTHWPNFSITDRPVIDAGKKVFGPFCTRKYAADFKYALQEAFLLCRCPNLLSNPKKVKSCPYFQMQTCLRPCSGNISRGQYLEQITAAIKAIGNMDEQRAILNNQMQQFSAKLDFEKAQNVKKQLDNLNLLDTDTYRWVSGLDSLAILHIDKSAKIKIPKQKRKVQTYAVFLIRAGEIIEMGDFKIEEAFALYESVKEKISAPITTPGNPKEFAEKLSIVSYYLYRSSRSGIWLKCQEIISVEEITEAVRQKFEK
jgi:excinuclease UvrABC nuclease subunit